MLTKEWIGGFISGEGCFTFLGITPICQITLSNKDKNILYEIKKSINLGKVSCNINSVFKVSGINDCLKLIKIMDNHILGDKKIDFENWRKGINFIVSRPKKEHLSKQDVDIINKLKPRQNKERKLFKNINIGVRKKIVNHCKECNIVFITNSGKEYYCYKCQLKNHRKYNLKYQQIFRKNNPKYYRNLQRKRKK